MKFSLFGNCQAQAVYWLLQQNVNFKQDYEIVNIKASFEMNANEAQFFYEEIIPSLDLLIMQPHSGVKSFYHDHEKIRKRCLEYGVKIVAIPQVYFSGYNPWERNFQFLSFLPDVSEEVLYFDCFLASAILNGVVLQDFLKTVNIVTPDRVKYIASEMEYGLSVLRQMESDRRCDIFMSSYIENNFKHFRLMNNVNHPEKDVMARLASEILSFCGYDSVVSPFNLFPNHQTLVYQFVAQYNGYSNWSDEQEISKRYKTYFDFFSSITQVQKEDLLNTIKDYVLPRSYFEV